MAEKLVTIRWRDLDALGHVNNAVYLTYLEEALNEWLSPVVGLDWVTARVEIDFRRELRGVGATVRAVGRVERVGTTSVTVAVELRDEAGEQAASARVVAVAWDAETRGPRRLTAEQRAALEAL